MTKLRWKIAQFAEKNWWSLYLRNKPTDLYLENKQKYWRRVLQQIGVEIHPDSHILDAGCGPAGIFIISPALTDAVDPLLDYYKMEISHFSPADWPSVSFYTQTIETIDTLHTYDQIFCLNAINHVQDIRLATQQLVDKLKPGGQLIISSDAHKHAVLKPIFQWIPGDILHPHQYDKTDYELIWQNAGLSIQASYCLKKEAIFDYWVWVCVKK